MKKALDAIGGYKTEHRGLVDVKVIVFYVRTSLDRIFIHFFSREKV